MENSAIETDMFGNIVKDSDTICIITPAIFSYSQNAEIVECKVFFDVEKDRLAYRLPNERLIYALKWNRERFWLKGCKQMQPQPEPSEVIVEELRMLVKSMFYSDFSNPNEFMYEGELTKKAQAFVAKYQLPFQLQPDPNLVEQFRIDLSHLTCFNDATVWNYFMDKYKPYLQSKPELTVEQKEIIRDELIELIDYCTESCRNVYSCEEDIDKEVNYKLKAIQYFIDKYITNSCALQHPTCSTCINLGLGSICGNFVIPMEITKPTEQYCSSHESR